MIKVFALVGIDGEVHVVHQNREELEAYLEKEPMVAIMCAEEIVEMDYNDDPVTERGLELEEKIKAALVDVKKIHINKQVGFYAMHIDDRYQLIYDVLTRVDSIDEHPEILDADIEQHPIPLSAFTEAPKSKQPQVDLEEKFKS